MYTYLHTRSLHDALPSAPLDKVKVVVLGQDPDHGEGQAHGLCFSVKPGVRTPPSLVNIYKELQSDLGLRPPRHGFLEHRSEEHTSELQSLMRISYAVFCLKKKKKRQDNITQQTNLHPKGTQHT